MRSIFRLLRPHQWLKNGFVFLPLFFDRRLMEIPLLESAFIAFLSYSLAASSIYCFNDIWDVEADRQHPKKCKRPIASGTVSVPMASMLAVFCALMALLFSYYFLPVAVMGLIVLYLVLNVAYCIRLKHIAIVDVFVIAFGFVLRILVGGGATGVLISHWIVLMTFLLALFLAFAKRRDDVVIYEGTGVKARKNVNRYNLAFMNQAIGIIASVTMVCYILYTVSEDVVARMGSSYLYVTSIFVLAGIIRYLQLTIVDVRSGSPTKVLLTDHFIHLCIAGWLVAFFIILYLP